MLTVSDGLHNERHDGPGRPDPPGDLRAPRERSARRRRDRQRAAGEPARRLAAPEDPERRRPRDRRARRHPPALPHRRGRRRRPARLPGPVLESGPGRLQGGGPTRPTGGLMTQQATIPAVRREITVDAPPERAFSVFTEGMASWWPRDSHNVGDLPAEAVLEPHEGGRIYSRSVKTGAETEWGRVLAWEPPVRLVFAWLFTPQWELETEVARTSEVEVRFTDAGGGRTQVVLEHRGFERMPDGGQTMREQVDGAGGWSELMEHYEAAFAP